LLAALLGILRLMFATLPQVLLNGWAAALLAVAVILVYIQYRRIAVMEAELHGVAKHLPLQQTMSALVLGLVGGLVGSVALSLAGVGLVEVPGTASALLYLWPVSVALGWVNPRFFCFAYSGSLMALASLATGWPRIDVPSVMGLVAVLHMVEALLIYLSGYTLATPMSINGQYEQAVPGFMLQRFWPVPLVLPLFSLFVDSPVAMPHWWPLLRPDAHLVQAVLPFGWKFLPFVVTMGYSDLAITAPPEIRARQSSRVLLVYSGILLLLAIGAGHWRFLMWVAAVFSALGHETMAVWSGRVQLLGDPYLKRPAKGVAVLDVLPGSPALAAGIRTGTVILTVDDYEVNHREDLHQALMKAPAYVRILYRNGRQLEQCRLQRPAEGLFGFGAILVPEYGDRALAQLRRPSFFRYSGLER
jgi:hypothetical protein